MNAQEQALVSQLLGNLQQAASKLAPNAIDPVHQWGHQWGQAPLILNST